MALAILNAVPVIFVENGSFIIEENSNLLYPRLWRGYNKKAPLHFEITV
jgi:hypothetical protein